MVTIRVLENSRANRLLGRDVELYLRLELAGLLRTGLLP